MKQIGWLFDVYAHPQKGVILWFVGEGGKPYSFYQEFETVFYARGSKERLHDLGVFLRKKYSRETVRLEKVTDKEDLFDGPQIVMGMGIANFILFKKIFSDVEENFADLIFYNSDIPLSVRYAAAKDVFMMARCEVEAEEDGKIVSIKALDTPEQIDTTLPKLRILRLSPDTDPSHRVPKFLIAKFGKSSQRLSFDQPRELISLLNSILSSYDPDVILTRFGDSWLFAKLFQLSRKMKLPFKPNRDIYLPVVRKKEANFFNYGRAHHRAAQFHLRGRWHIDIRNGMTYNHYGLIGAIEQARFSSLPVQEVARRSPGAAIASMQNLTALKRGVLVPYRYQKGEIPKIFSEFVRGDRGGLVHQPPPGIYKNVAILDFSSMMASIMIRWNVSPETVVDIEDERNGFKIPDLGVKILSTLGLVPQALKPMRDKRLTLKKQLRAMQKEDPRYQALLRELIRVTRVVKGIVDSLKWLAVVCYGRLGFANATFGRLNSHEVVSYLSRKVILQAKVIAEKRGFRVLHLYVDSLFVSKASATAEDYQALTEEIEQKTELPLDFDRTIFPWFAFLATRENPEVSVANRFYGLSPDGNDKIRGIALRRSDTPLFVANLQMSVLEILRKEANPAKLASLLPEIVEFVQATFAHLKDREVPLEELLITQTLSRELDEYSVSTPLWCAARQLQAQGKKVRRGWIIRYMYVAKAPGVYAWDLPFPPKPQEIDVIKYKELAFRAIYETLQPLGVRERVLRDWILRNTGYIVPKDLRNPSRQIVHQELPLFSKVKDLRVDMA